LLRKHLAQLVSCAPLEAPASGLVVLSQDGRVVRKFAEDGAIMEHEIVAEVRGSLSPEALQQLGRSLPGLKVSWQSEQRLRFAIKGPVPGQVAALCERAGLAVVGIKRIRIGRVPMSGLAPGQWRYLQPGARF
jgi:23S rRNA pseudouridine2604 synthase